MIKETQFYKFGYDELQIQGQLYTYQNMGSMARTIFGVESDDTSIHVQ